MNYILYNKTELNKKEFHDELLSLLGLFSKSYFYYLDIKNDTIHYLLFGKKIELIQVIFKYKKSNMNENFNILEYAFKSKKIAKNHIHYIDKITQYIFILYNNERRFEFKEWTFKEDNNIFPSDIYSVKLYNLFYIQKKENSNYKELSNLIFNL